MARGTVEITTLGNPDPTVENTLGDPEVVVPVESRMPVPGAQFAYRFAPYSLTILRIPTLKPIEMLKERATPE